MWKLLILLACFMTLMVSAGKNISENKNCLRKCFVIEQMGLGKTIPEFSADCRKRADRCRNSCHAKKDEIAEIDEDEGEDED